MSYCYGRGPEVYPLLGGCPFLRGSFTEGLRFQLLVTDFWWPQLQILNGHLKNCLIRLW